MTHEFLSVTAQENFSIKKASSADREIDRVFFGKLKACREIETDQESNGSSEDMESPRSVVAKVRKWPAPTINKNVSIYVHSQILRIREEDSHIGEDIPDNFTAATSTDDSNHNSKIALATYHHRVDVLVIPHKPILPASPLSGKTAMGSIH